MGVLLSRSGMAFEIWSQDERFTSRAEVLSDSAYWTRQGVHPPCPGYDPDAQVNRSCANSIFAGGNNVPIPAGEDLTVACRVRNRGDGLLTLSAWVSTHRGQSLLCYGGMGEPIARMLTGECVGQGIGKAVAGCDHLLKKTFEHSDFADTF